jgi:hypothetical protein
VLRRRRHFRRQVGLYHQGAGGRQRACQSAAPATQVQHGGKVAAKVAQPIKQSLADFVEQEVVRRQGACGARAVDAMGAAVEGRGRYGGIHWRKFAFPAAPIKTKRRGTGEWAVSLTCRQRAGLTGRCGSPPMPL